MIKKLYTKFSKKRKINRFLKAAAIAFNKDDFKKTKSNYLNVLLLDPNNYEANLYLGVLYRELKVYSQSEIHLRSAIRIEPTNDLPYTLLGAQKFWQRQYNESIVLYQNAIDYCEIGKSKKAEILYSMALVKYNQGDYRKAIEFGNDALNLYPKYKSAEEIIVYSHMKMKRK